MNAIAVTIPPERMREQLAVIMSQRIIRGDDEATFERDFETVRDGYRLVLMLAGLCVECNAHPPCGSCPNRREGWYANRARGLLQLKGHTRRA